MDEQTVISDHIPEKRGTGYGFSYDADIVRIIAQPISDIDDVLDDERRAFFTQTIETTERLLTGLSASEHSYNGSWCYQGGEPTCLPWAVANAIHTLGVSADHSYIADLLNYAIDAEESAREGMNYPVAIDMLEKYPRIGVSIKRIPYERELQLIHEPPREDLGKMLYIIDDSRTPEEIAIDSAKMYQAANTQAVQRNGTLVKEIVDSGDVLLTSVMTKQYAKDKKSGLHAICVAGYKVSKQGNMDVQVIDAARGKLWMSLEHLSSAIVPFDTFRMTKK